MTKAWVEAVNRFWFHELNAVDWFSGRAEIDAAIAGRFGDLRARLKEQPPASEQLDAAGHLAGIIVFDQFSRNLFRHSAEAYATDSLALDLARDAVDRGLDGELSSEQRQFLYMPFMHCEDPGMQALSLALFCKLGDADALQYAEHHKGVIDRFGRFPHRNAVLGRMTTEVERAFLSTEPAY